VFHGVYHGKRHHEDDLDDIIQRAVDAGCKKFMVTASDLKEAKKAIEIVEKYRTAHFHKLSLLCSNSNSNV